VARDSGGAARRKSTASSSSPRRFCHSNKLSCAPARASPVVGSKKEDRFALQAARNPVREAAALDNPRERCLTVAMLPAGFAIEPYFYFIRCNS
jgi:hypothetical protein